EAEKVAQLAVKYRERGVVGLGLVGTTDARTDEPFARAFAVAREGGVGSVPHAGEVTGAESVRAALDVLHADRIRHGIRAEEEPGAGARRELRLARRAQPLEFPRDGDRKRSGAGRLAPRGKGGGPRPRGSARRLPNHARHAWGRGARAHPVPAGQDPRLLL